VHHPHLLMVFVFFSVKLNDPLKDPLKDRTLFILIIELRYELPCTDVRQLITNSDFSLEQRNMEEYINGKPL
jgi:hypothetical protein